jgi:hypothetical protein
MHGDRFDARLSLTAAVNAGSAERCTLQRMLGAVKHRHDIIGNLPPELLEHVRRWHG